MIGTTEDGKACLIDSVGNVTMWPAGDNGIGYSASGPRAFVCAKRKGIWIPEAWDVTLMDRGGAAAGVWRSIRVGDGVTVPSGNWGRP